MDAFEETSYRSQDSQEGSDRKTEAHIIGQPSNVSQVGGLAEDILQELQGQVSGGGSTRALVGCIGGDFEAGDCLGQSKGGVQLVPNLQPWGICNQCWRLNERLNGYLLLHTNATASFKRKH